MSLRLNMTGIFTSYCKCRILKLYEQQNFEIFNLIEIYNIVWTDFVGILRFFYDSIYGS